MFLSWCSLIFYCGVGFLSFFVNLFEFSEGIRRFYRDIIMKDKVKVEDINCFTIPWSIWKQFCITNESAKMNLTSISKKKKDMSPGIDITIRLNLRPKLASVRTLPRDDGILHFHIWSRCKYISFNFMIWHFGVLSIFVFIRVKSKTAINRIE